MPKPKFLIGVSSDDESGADEAPDSESGDMEEKDPGDELARLLKVDSAKFRALMTAYVQKCMDESE